jgi:hypothetical protein
VWESIDMVKSSVDFGATHSEPPRIWKKWLLVCCVSVFMYVLVCALLAPEWVDILFVFDIQGFIHHRLMPSEYDHSNSKNGAFQIGPKTKLWSCQKWLHLLNFSNLWRPSPKLKLFRWYLQKNNDTHTLEDQTQFCHNWLYQSEDFCLVFSSEFHFEGKVIKVNCV